MTRGRRRLLAVALAALAVALAGCADPENVEIAVEAPALVKKGQKFEVKARVKNTASETQRLVSLDIGDKYLAGVKIEAAQPPYSESMHIPLDNSMSYTFELELQPNEERVVTFQAVALKPGDFRDEVDFCINSPISFLSQQVRTVVEP